MKERQFKQMNSCVQNSASLPSQSLFGTSGLSGNLPFFLSLASFSAYFPPIPIPVLLPLTIYTQFQNILLCQLLDKTASQLHPYLYLRTLAFAPVTPLFSPHSSIVTSLGTPSSYSPLKSCPSNSPSHLILC